MHAYNTYHFDKCMYPFDSAGPPPPAIPPDVVNLALGKQAYCNTSYTSYPASYAVDGLDTFFMSDYYDITPWLAVDLTTPSLISQVVLHIPPGYGYHLYNAQIRISNFSVASTDNGTDGISGGLLVWTLQGYDGSLGPIIRIQLSEPVVGKWVTLQNFHPGRRGRTIVRSHDEKSSCVGITKLPMCCRAAYDAVLVCACVD